MKDVREDIPDMTEALLHYIISCQIRRERYSMGKERCGVILLKIKSGLVEVKK